MIIHPIVLDKIRNNKPDFVVYTVKDYIKVMKDLPEYSYILFVEVKY